ncbi:hypothetical protein AB1A81_01815 [Bdellovibrio bacteriovorus]|uniref:Uncharacterized protein n=1 Tax=Bdellovibrio bacteriovorus (strain ATCC 15356 / DSM 50701 / NCIMB 9529 / HD100) TaxID=264462 RepID=Q6MQS0_BDEBA|nr:hypothetical protein [Bdellovibrio bacteriovorus]AHZ86014.1 hypothetical protein EP01_13885 [Bdellovibrio bacteriovorus]BEV66938.1 hypothetical protein Bb109J_c0358 [Bdellovibrio bacteriovorus]CAE78377.1 hypothetical protein predicted by Glimmer/Critica [Bdellovibrio bacteriovorus HD100]
MSQLEHLPHPSRLPSLNHHTLAFFSNPEDARKAASELVNAGFHEADINVFEGDDGVEAVDLDSIHADLMEKYYRKFVKFSDSAEWHFLTEADDELRRGHILMCLVTMNVEEKDAAVPILRKHKAFDMRYCTGIAIEEVV